MYVCMHACDALQTHTRQQREKHGRTLELFALAQHIKNECVERRLDGSVNHHARTSSCSIAEHGPMIAPPELDLVSICGRCRVHGVRVCGEHGNRTSADKARAARRISPTRGFATRSSLTAGEGHAAVAEGRGRRAKRGRKRGCAQRSNRAGRRGPRPHQRRRREGRRAVESGRGGEARTRIMSLPAASRQPPPRRSRRPGASHRHPGDRHSSARHDAAGAPTRACAQARRHALTGRPPRAAALWIAPRAVRWTSAWVLGTSSLFVTILGLPVGHSDHYGYSHRRWATVSLEL